MPPVEDLEQMDYSNQVCTVIISTWIHMYGFYIVCSLRLQGNVITIINYLVYVHCQIMIIFWRQELQPRYHRNSMESNYWLMSKNLGEIVLSEDVARFFVNSAGWKQRLNRSLLNWHCMMLRSAKR